jgi:predicted transcriptional regulator
VKDRDIQQKVSVTAEIGVPDWLPFKARLQATYEALWSRRSLPVITAVADDLGGQDQLAERIEADAELADVFEQGMKVAATTHHDGLRDAVTAVIRAAFHDDARLELNAYLLDLLGQMQPAHLRVLKAIDSRRDESYLDELEPLVDADRGVLAGAVRRLESLGLVDYQYDAWPGPRGPRWRPTELGGAMVEIGMLGVPALTSHLA